MNNKLNTDGMFSSDLVEVVRMEDAISDEIDALDSAIKETNRIMKELKDNRSLLLAPIDEKRASIQQSIVDMLAMTDDKDTQKTIRENLHHAITITVTKALVYDAKKALEYVIKNESWGLINKPSLSKSAMKKAYKAQSLDWIEVTETENVSVKIAPLGDIRIMLENEDES